MKVRLSPWTTTLALFTSSLLVALSFCWSNGHLYACPSPDCICMLTPPLLPRVYLHIRIIPIKNVHCFAFLLESVLQLIPSLYSLHNECTIHATHVFWVSLTHFFVLPAPWWWYSRFKISSSRFTICWITYLLISWERSAHALSIISGAAVNF